MKHFKIFIGAAVALSAVFLNFRYAYGGYGITGNPLFSQVLATGDSSSDSESERCDDSNSNHLTSCHARQEKKAERVQCTVFFCKVYLCRVGSKLKSLILDEKSTSTEVYSYADMYQNDTYSYLTYYYEKEIGSEVRYLSSSYIECIADEKGGPCSDTQPSCSNAEMSD